MKLHCKVEVIDRNYINVLNLSLQKKSQRGCLIIGKESSKTNELCILLQTQNIPWGTKYMLNDNIETIFQKFVANGKATIRIKKPPHDLLIQSDPIQLKSFLHVLEDSLSNKVTLSTIDESNLNRKKLLNEQKTKIVIKKNVEYPTLKGFPRYTEELMIAGLNRKSFDLQILKLNNLKVLNLSGNQIKSLPKQLGCMPHLQELYLFENQLGKATMSKWDWLEQDNIRKNLRLLDLTSNWLVKVPEQIGKLSGIVNVKLGFNSIRVLPHSFGKLTSLRYLDLSHNCLEYLPGGIKKLQLSEISIIENLFLIDYIPEPEFKLKQNLLVPSLVECAATIVATASINYNARLIPRTLVQYLDSATSCMCGKISFQSYIQDILYSKFDYSPMLVRSSQYAPIPFDCFFCSLHCYRYYKRNCR